MVGKRPHTLANIGGVELKNPVMTASGTFGYGSEFEQLVDLNRLGAIIVKGLSIEPTKGNPPPRITETACGMLNAIGLENVGFSAFIKEKLPFLKTIAAPTLVNIYGKRVSEYAELAERIDDIEDISGVEVNISCPNVKHGGLAFGAYPDSASEVVRAVRERTSKLLMVKLSPNVTDITEIACSVEAAGADSISLINTITGMAVDIETRYRDRGHYDGKRCPRIFNCRRCGCSDWYGQFCKPESHNRDYRRYRILSFGKRDFPFGGYHRNT